MFWTYHYLEVITPIYACRVIFGDQGYLICFWFTKLFHDFDF